MGFVPIKTLVLFSIWFILAHCSEENNKPRSYFGKILANSKQETNYDQNFIQISNSIEKIDIQAEETKISCTNKGIPVQYTQGNSTKQVCICPLDKTGDNCGVQRTFQCTNKLITPIRACKLPQDRKIGGKYAFFDNPCIFVNSNDTIQFNLTIQCNFTQNPHYILYNIPTNINFTRVDRNISGLSFTQLQSSFTYYLRSDNSLDPNFALTNAIPQPHEFRIINFYKFSDLTHYRYLTLDPNHFLFNKQFGSSVWFGNLSSEFYAGQRVYMEVGYSGVDGLDMNWERIYVDFNDISEPRAPIPWENILKYTGIAVGSAIGVMIILVSLGCYFWTDKKKKDDLKEK